MTGTVIFYDRLQGYGFAVPADNGPDVFLHRKNLVGAHYLNRNDQIEFAMGEREGRPLALMIRRLESPVVPERGGR